MRKNIFWLIPLLCALAVPAAQAGNAAKGKALAENCAGCHGADGNSVGTNFPNLAGQTAEYITHQLKLFRSGERKVDPMNDMAAPLSDQDIDDLAAHFASQTMKPPAHSDSAQSERGKAHYAMCTGCHGTTAMGSHDALAIPRLAGQHADYLAKTLHDFRDGKRNNAIMQSIVATFKPGDIEDLAEYLESMK